MHTPTWLFMRGLHLHNCAQVKHTCGALSPALLPAAPCPCSALLEERLEKVYKADARYSDKAATMFNLDLGAPEVNGLCF